MRLILIRHGDPDYANDSLTEKGHRQAELLAESMRWTEIDKLFVSPMGRAQLTCGYLARAKLLEPETLAWLHELNGNYADESWAWNFHGCELHRQDISWSADNWWQHVPYGSHMLAISAEFYRQFDAFLEHRGYTREGQRYRLTTANDDTIAIVCHAGVILTLLSRLLNIPLPIVYSHFEISPTGRTCLATESVNGYAVWRMLHMNDVSHTAS